MNKTPTAPALTLMTLLVTGLLASPGVALALPPAPLAPTCTDFGFAGPSTLVEPTTGWQVTFNSNGTDATGVGTASNDRGESKTGTMGGYIHGKKVRVIVDYDNRQRQIYKGTVGANGVASGITDNGIDAESFKPFTLLVTCLK